MMQSFDAMRTLSVNRITSLRLVCAYIVLFSHLDWMSGQSADPLRRYGLYSVAVFFGLSGFLLTGSILKQGRNKSKFLVNRVLRIFPGYILVLVLTGFIFTPVLQLAKSNGDKPLLSSENFSYVFYNLTTKIIQSDINGVLSSTSVPNWNPSLWTLEYEVSCYLFLFLGFSFFGKAMLKHIHFILLASIFLYLTLNYLVPSNFEIRMIFYYLGFFTFGSFLYLRARLPDRKVMLFSLFFLVISLQIPRQNLEDYFDARDFMIGLFVIPIFLCLAFYPVPRRLIKNDYSFGIYIYAGPANHLILGFFQEIQEDWWKYAFSVLVLTSVFAYTSWHLVEKRALKFKR